MAQIVYGIVKAVSDDSAFSDGNGRFVADCVFNQTAHIGKAVDFTVNTF